MIHKESIVWRSKRYDRFIILHENPITGYSMNPNVSLTEDIYEATLASFMPKNIRRDYDVEPVKILIKTEIKIIPYESQSGDIIK